MASATDFRGIARNVEYADHVQRGNQTDRNFFVSLSFRLEQYDEHGNTVALQQIQALRRRGRSAYPVRGGLIDGDEVIVRGSVKKSGVIEPDSVLNLRTGADVISGKDPITAGQVVGATLFVVVALLILAAAAFIGFMFLNFL